MFVVFGAVFAVIGLALLAWVCWIRQTGLRAQGVVVSRRAAHARYTSTAAVAASSAAPIAIRAICQPGIPPITTVWTGTRTGVRHGGMCPGGSGGCLFQPAGAAAAGRGERGGRGRGERQQGTGQPGQGGAQTADVADAVHDDLLRLLL